MKLANDLIPTAIVVIVVVILASIIIFNSNRNQQRVIDAVEQSRQQKQSKLDAILKTLSDEMERLAREKMDAR